HVGDYVATCVIVCAGKPCHDDGYGIGYPLRTPFYVCPRTGMLKKNSRYRDGYHWRLERLIIRFVGSTAALARKDGEWYVINTETFHPPLWTGKGYNPSRPFRHWDALLKQEIYREQATYVYGYPIFAVSARRASKREVRQVVNSYPFTNYVR